MIKLMWQSIDSLSSTVSSFIFILRLRTFSMPVAIALITASSTLSFQSSDSITNGSMEIESQRLKSVPAAWVFSARVLEQGVAIAIDTEEALEGENSTLIDTTKLTNKDPRFFVTFNQYLDPKTYPSFVNSIGLAI